MSTDVNHSAADSSSPAPASLPDLASLSSSELTSWRHTGTLPESPSSASLAASTPAEPVEQAASTDATQQPASEPGVSDQTAKPRKNADTRKEELNREIRDLLARRDAVTREVEDAERKRETTRPASEPASPRPAVTASTIKPDLTKEPLSEDDFFTLEGATLGHYSLYMGRYAAAEQAAERERTARLTARNDAFKKRMDEAGGLPPDIVSQIPPKLLRAERVENLPADAPIGPLNVVAQEIYESEHPGQLIRHFTDHPDELDAVERLTTHAAVVRAVARIEATFTSPVSPVVPVKTQSSAPPPPTTLGRKPALVADEVENAVREGDFRRFKDEANRREQAAMTGR